jgi:hypothetical protein
MNTRIALTLALALLAVAPAAAAGRPMTPMNAGFHQLLHCNTQGYVTVDVAPGDPHIAPNAMLVTTAVAVGPSMTKTQAYRGMDAQGNIYAYGYLLQPGVTKRFAKALLLPASPPAAGERSTYYSISGAQIEKRFNGMQPTKDAHGAAANGFAFSDYLKGRKLNTVVYLPAIGVSELTFYGVLPNAGDLICHANP